MIKPIYAYGSKILRQIAEEIEEDYEGLEDLITDLEETMYKAEGVGLAAPQIGESFRLFMIDAQPMAEDYPDVDGFKRVFINPVILEESGKPWFFNEGCLSVPGVREDIRRKPNITIEYYNRELELLEEKYEGTQARIIQHEYDHLEGILFTDHVAALKRKLLAPRLSKISKGNVDVKYKMYFPRKK